MQLGFQLVLCAVGAQSVFPWEPGLSVASLLVGQAVFTGSVPGKGFSLCHGGQVFCNFVFSLKGQGACQFNLFGGLFPCAKLFSFCLLVISFCLMGWLS